MQRVFHCQQDLRRDRKDLRSIVLQRWCLDICHHRTEDACIEGPIKPKGEEASSVPRRDSHPPSTSPPSPLVQEKQGFKGVESTGEWAQTVKCLPVFGPAEPPQKSWWVEALARSII